MVDRVSHENSLHEYDFDLPVTHDFLEETEIKFCAGNIKNCLDEWKKITNDKHVLETVSGCNIDLIATPYQPIPSKQINFSEDESKIIEDELLVMLEKGVIEKTLHEEGEFVSNIFLRPKKDGKFRVILNLKPFNQFVDTEHFKMDSITTCINLMKQDCHMASIDLRDAYYSVPIRTQDRKFLKFKWNGQLYGYTCLPMGLACAPRKFVKLLKPVFAHLHSEGFISSGYLDDIFLQGDNYNICMENVERTISLLTKLGFFIHFKKSIMTPCTKMEHLGFVLDSQDMKVSLTDEKHKKLNDKIDKLLTTERPTIRAVASTIGSMISYMPAVRYGPMHYRSLEREKIKSLRDSKGNFDACMSLSEKAIEQLNWWRYKAKLYPELINIHEPDHVICTDASGAGWGAKMADQECGGRWSESERECHINELELRAVEFGLKSLCGNLNKKHILVKSDNVTTVAYVRNMGGCKSIKCDIIATRIWEWAIEHDIWLTITHIEGRLNTDPDALSRVFDDKTEWMINPILFRLINKRYKPEIDLFASRLNRQLDLYVTWQPDPHAIAVNAFTFNWAGKLNYIFCPFSVIPQALAKLERERAEAVMIAPFWPAQSWFAKLTRLLVETPKMLPRGRRQLLLPFDKSQTHPMWRKMLLMVCHLSGDTLRNQEFRRHLRESYSVHGGPVHTNNTVHTSINGPSFAIDGVWIDIKPLS